MIRLSLETLLLASGVTVVMYESEELSNIIADESKINDIVGLIQEPKVINLEPRGNGVDERYYPTVIEIMKQSSGVEAGALNNEPVYLETWAIVRAFVQAIIRGGEYKKIDTIPATKITEKRYDANLIGWSLSLNLIPVTPETIC